MQQHRPRGGGFGDWIGADEHGCGPRQRVWIAGARTALLGEDPPTSRPDLLQTALAEAPTP